MEARSPGSAHDLLLRDDPCLGLEPATAVAKWNTAGGSIRSSAWPAARAQLTIGFGNVGAAAGMATVGPTRNAWVRLNPAYRSADATDAHYRIEVMAIFTHELGHVLGFDHTSTAAPMVPCSTSRLRRVTPAHAGYYKCQTIDRSLVTPWSGATAAGRGRPRLPGA